MAGTKRCTKHAGIPRWKAKAQGQVVMELKKWGLDGHSTMKDAGEVLLKLVTQSSYRVEFYSQLLAEAYELAERGDSLDGIMTRRGVGALIGYRYGVDREGNRFAIEEAIRGLAQLELTERKLCADFATKAIAAGLAERQVRLAEQQGAMLYSVISAVLGDLRLSPEQEALIGEVVPRRLREILG